MNPTHGVQRIRGPRMNLEDLQKILREECIDMKYISMSTNMVDETYCIEERSGTWYVFYRERGLRTSEKSFEREEEACKELLERVLRDRTIRET